MSPLLSLLAAGLEFLGAIVVAVNAGDKMGRAWDAMQEERANPYPEVPDDVIDIQDCGAWCDGDGSDQSNRGGAP